MFKKKEIFLLLIFISFLLMAKNTYANTWDRAYDSTNYYYNKGQFKTALNWALKSKELSLKEFGEKSEQYQLTLYKLVDLYFYTGDVNNAIAIAREDSAVTMAIYGKCSEKYVSSLNNLGLIYFYAYQDFKSAKNLLLAAKYCLENKNMDNDSLYAFTISNVGLVFEVLNEFSSAEPLYLKAIEIFKKLNLTSDYNYVVTVHNLAALYKRMGKYQKSEELFKLDIKLTKKILGKNSPELANVMNNVGDLYRFMGKYDESEKMYKHSVDLRKKIFGEKHKNYARSLSNLALLYLNMGRYEKAEEIFLKAADIQKNLGENNTDYASTLNNLALLYFWTDKNSKAEQLYKKVLEIYRTKFGEEHSFYAITLENLARLYKSENRFKLAEKKFLRVKQIREKVLGIKHPLYAKTLFYLGELYQDIKKYNQAENYFKDALKLRKKVIGKDHPDYATNLIALAKLYHYWDKLDLAEPYYKSAIDAYFDLIKRYFPYLSENEKLQFWMSIRNSFEDFNIFCSEYYKENPKILNQMYNNLLTTKGLILSSTKKVFSKIRQSGDEELIELFDKWQESKNYWLWLVQNPQKAEELAVDVDFVEDFTNDLEKKLSSKSSDFRKAFESKTITYQNIIEKLSDDEAAIEIVRFNSKLEFTDGDDKEIYYAALIITSNSREHAKIVILENGKELENKYIRLYSNLVDIQKIRPFKKSSEFEVESLKEDAKILYKEFWAKISEQLDYIKRVYLSVDGVYNSLNLATLINPETNKYLLEEIDLRIVTNTKDIIDYKKNTENIAIKKAVLVGNPKYNIDNSKSGFIPELPGTMTEIQKISSKMKANNWEVEKYLEANATEKNVKSIDNPTILHIATHGVFLEDVSLTANQGDFATDGKALANPLLRSMLYFTGVENSDKRTINDGKLTAFEAMDLNLEKTDLVVLSACETGLGEVKNGEGVYGLQRAFQVAGTDALIMSLWTVSDDATQLLMTKFYNYFIHGNDKRTSFRKAQLDLKKEYPEFYFWGAFVMVGE